MIEFFSDKKTLTAIAGAFMAVLVQVAAKHGMEIDQAGVNTLTAAVVVIFASLIGGHAHVEHAEVHADAHVEATEIQNAPRPLTANDAQKGGTS